MPIVGPLIVGAASGAVLKRYGISVPSIQGQFMNNPQIEAQAFEQAKRYLIAEEGIRNTVYRDSLGIPTVGIGHRVLPEDNLKVGDTISTQRVNELFAKDINKAFKAAVSQAKDLNKYNVEMIARLTSVNFQMGTGWKHTFANTWAYLENGQYQQAIANLQRSRWAQQTPSRVAAFINTIRNQYA